MNCQKSVCSEYDDLSDRLFALSPVLGSSKHCRRVTAATLSHSCVNRLSTNDLVEESLSGGNPKGFVLPRC